MSQINEYSNSMDKLYKYNDAIKTVSHKYSSVPDTIKEFFNSKNITISDCDFNSEDENYKNFVKALDYVLENDPTKLSKNDQLFLLCDCAITPYTSLMKFLVQDKKINCNGYIVTEEYDYCIDTHRTPLSTAVEANNKEQVLCLLSIGAKTVDDRDSYDIAGDHNLLLLAIHRRNTEIFKILLDAGADFDYDADGNTISNYPPLNYALRYGKYEFVKILAKAGARWDTTDYKGNTPRWYAMEQGLDVYKEFGIKLPYDEDYDNTDDDSDSDDNDSDNNSDDSDDDKQMLKRQKI